MEAARGRPDAVDAVKVIVRVRPLNSKERQEQTKSCIRIASSLDGLSSNNRAEASGPQQLIVGKDRAFTFDGVFGIDSSQQDVYRNNVEPLVDCFLEGYNATVLAYGQTGTGKTHTMSGSSVDPKGGKGQDLQGIIPRVIRTIFEKMQSNQQRKEFSLRIEYIEIYNEELRDLLHPETPSKQLSIREDAEGNIIMAGVKSEMVQSKEAVFRLLSLGGASRVTGSTMMNEQSSRSHAIFSLIVQQRDLATGECRKAKFHLVDLAGSERAKRTGAVAGRFKESISINQGLLALGNVISALGDEKRKVGTADKAATGTTTTGGLPPPSGGSVHVPYRDSKLTRLLQDSLGGNAKTLMIACVSPATINFEETLNTLKYANRAKNIKNRPIVNQQSQEEKQKADDEIARMKEEIALLQSQLQVTKPRTPSTAGSSGRPETGSSSSSSRHRRHSVAVSTSTVSLVQDTAVEQEMTHLRKKCRAYAETIEAMRSLTVEAITSLVTMERDIKPLGRPVQQRLNEIVKMLNAAVQTVGSVESSLRKSLSVVPGEAGSSGQSNGDAVSMVNEELHQRLTKELRDAKANLARDEQIFEMKNAEIKRLQTFVTEAKVKNEKLIQKVQELERGGQLWTNPGPGAAGQSLQRSEGHPVDDTVSAMKSGPEDQRVATAATHRKSVDTLASREDDAAKRSTSSRGLFTKRTGTVTGFEPQEDNVVIGNEEEDTLAKSRNKSFQSKPSTARRSVTSSHRGSLSASGDAREESGSVSKMEKKLATLRGKVEELQQQNGELQHGREESVRRWQLERQQYEREINEAEQAIEALRKANQALEDSLMEDKDNQAKPVASSLQISTIKRASQPSVSQIVLDENGSASGAGPMSNARRPKTAARATPAELLELYDVSVRRLIEFNQARQQVLHLLKEKKAAQQNVEDANRRLNALEMQKLRQSMSLRESIADVSASLRHINEKMQLENKTVEEIERLKKLKERAERKLKTLRRQEEKGDFLDKETQQEVVDLEELIEDLNSHIAFQDAELVSAREEMELIRKRSQLEEQSPLDALAQGVVDRFDSNDASAAVLAFVKKCFEDVARLRAREQELLHAVKERQSAVEERDAAVNQLEGGLTAARKEFDRRLQLQIQESEQVVGELEAQISRLTAEATQTQHERNAQLDKLQPQSLEPESSIKDEEWQKLIVSCQKKDEYITDLEKHVVFYKSKAKQMQAQLQQLIRDSAGNQDDQSDETHEENLQLQKRVQQLEEANDALMKDLATAKASDSLGLSVYLRLSKSRTSAEGAQVVRISKSELRELPRPPTGVSSRDED